MRHLKDILTEADKDKEEKKEQKVVFVETDPQEPFPNDTIAALHKDIKKKSKDLEVDWKSSVEVVDAAFADLNVPKPQAYLKERWKQYRELLDYAIRSLYDSRGMKAAWAQTI